MGTGRLWRIRFATGPKANRISAFSGLKTRLSFSKKHAPTFWGACQFLTTVCLSFFVATQAAYAGCATAVNNVIVTAPATVFQSASSQVLTVRATVTSTGANFNSPPACGAPNGTPVTLGTLSFSVDGIAGTAAATLIGSGVFEASYTLPANQSAGPYTLRAAYTGSGTGSNERGSSSGTGAFSVVAGRTLSITGSGLGTGTVVGSPSSTINCTITAGVTSGTCSETVADGTVRTLTATASGGSNFTNWPSCDSAASNVCTQTVSGGNETVTANFGLVDVTPPTVTIEQGSGQADPTSASPIVFDVVFSEPVTGFTSAGVTLGGTAGATTAVVTPVSSTNYTVSVSGMTVSGTVTASVNAGAAQDAATNPNTASTSADNEVTYNAPVVDVTPPTVTIEQGSGQADPTSASPIVFDVVFSEPVTGFTSAGVTLGGTAGATAAVVTPVSSTNYTVSVSGMTVSGTVTASVNAGAAQDAATNPNTASTSADNEVTYNAPVVDVTPPTVTIEQGSGQADPTSASPIVFDVVFSEPVTGFTSAGVTLGGTAGATAAVVTPVSSTNYTVSVSGMTVSGTVTASVNAGAAQDAATNPNTASTSADNEVTYNAPVVDVTPPTVTIEQGSGQADPTSASPIVFDVVFSEPVTGFTSAGVTLGGTAGATAAVVTPVSSTNYTVSVSGMTVSGTVTASVNAGAAQDAATNPNTASTSADNEVTYNAPVVDVTPPTVTIEQGSGQADPTSASPIVFDVVFSEPVTGFTSAGVTLGGTAGATAAVVTPVSSTNYTVSVSGMTVSGTVTASVNAGAAQDAATNPNTASTSADNEVTYNAPVVDVTPPTVTIEQGSGQADPTSASPIVFDVVFSEPVTGFTSAGVTLGGTAGATTAVVTPVSSTNYTVSVSGMTVSGTVTASVNAGAAQDAATNPNTASTSADNEVTYNAPVVDVTPPTVTIEQGSGQADPTSASPIVFDVVFSEPVTGFTSAGVTLGGTAGATTAVVTPVSSTNYTVSVSGMTVSGTVTASVNAGAAQDAATNPNTASTSADNEVTYNAPVVVISISPATLPAGVAGTAYTQTLTASGGTPGYTFAVTTGALPAGLTLSPAGVISGTPTASGVFNFEVTATDSLSNTGTRVYSLTIAGLTIAVSPTALPPGDLRQPYSQAIVATGGVGPYTFAVAAGALPPGLTLDPATGLLAGTPMGHGVFNFTISATDALGFTGSRTYALKIGTSFVERRTREVIGNFIARRADALTSNEMSRFRDRRRFNGSLFGSSSNAVGGQSASLSAQSGAPVALNVSPDEDGNFSRLAFATSLKQLMRPKPPTSGAGEADDAARPDGMMALGANKAGDPGPLANSPFDLWVEGYMTHFEDDDGRSSGNVGIMYTGIDYQILPGLMIGALMQFDFSDQSSGLLGSEAEGHGWMAGPYISARLTENLYFDARAAWGESGQLDQPVRHLHRSRRRRALDGARRPDGQLAVGPVAVHADSGCGLLRGKDRQLRR